VARAEKLSLRQHPGVAAALGLWGVGAALCALTVARAPFVPGLAWGQTIIEGVIGLGLTALCVRATLGRKPRARVLAVLRVALWLWNPLAMMLVGLFFSREIVGGMLVDLREEIAGAALFGLAADLAALVVVAGPWNRKWWFVDPQNYWRVAMRQFGKRRLSRAGLWVVVALLGTAVAADFVASRKPILMKKAGRIYVLANIIRYYDILNMTNQELADSFQPGDWAVFPPLPYGPNQDRVRGDVAEHEPPSALHPLGTDDRGRDVAARMVHGARVSLSVGFVAVGIYTIIGVLLGALAGYFGGTIDTIISRLIEVMLTFPTFFLILVITGLLERITLVWIMGVIGITGWPRLARLVRGEVMRVKAMEFITASQALGVRPARIIARHVLPNAIGPVLVAATFGVASAILTEAALSFLGFGTPPPTATWGEILLQSFQYQSDWWMALFPGFAIFISATAYNIVGEGLRDAVDPQLREG
jgi:peptide/nickel transport system permease protein